MPESATPDARSALVLGAGLIGICTAIALRERGFQVQVIDRDEPGQGASMGNAGVISPWSCVPQSMPGLWKKIPKWLLDPEGPVALRLAYAPRMVPWLSQFFAAGALPRLPAIADAMLALNRPNLDLYRTLLAGTGSEDLIRDSMYVYISRDEADLNTQSLGWRLRAQRQVPFERISRGELQKIEPAIAADYPGAIVVHGQGRALSPGRIGSVLADKARGMGVEILRGEVSTLRAGQNNTWTAESSAGMLNARFAVVCSGVWSARLLASLGVKTPLEAERGYHMVFTQPGVSLNNSIHDVGSKVAISSMEMGIRCAGTAEFAGIDAPADYRRAQVFKELSKRIMPDLNVDPTTEWMGRRPSTPDSVPYIGPVPGQTGLFAAFGHGHLGLTGAPQTARMIAGLMNDDPVNIDYAPYRLDRFER